MNRISYYITLLILSSWQLNGQVTLNPCISNTDFTIVILGSSTAAGTGASIPDSAWVNRYRNSLQKINPNNQVINLGVGGFTTYKIMPDSFATPPNRPVVNFSKNIDEALTYNPDAILVNLPSNDKQWPKHEQLNNFDTLFKYSNNHNVPIFIFTTQPIVSTSFAQYQRDVADSILLKFGSNAINVFDPLKDTNNIIQPQYAADGVHLNDKGHGVLHDVVFQFDLLYKIYQPATGIDAGIHSIISSTTVCTDVNAQIGVVVFNLADTIVPGASVDLHVNGNLYQIPLNQGLGSCQSDTLYQTVNLGMDTTYTISASLQIPGDSVLENNQDSLILNLTRTPILNHITDTLCLGTLTHFDSLQVFGDTVLYYINDTVNIPLDSIPAFMLSKDTSIYAQGVSGDLVFKNILTTQEDGNINFNGNMFDLFVKSDITLDSIQIKPNSIGSIPVNVYIKTGSYKGHEQTASSWTLWTTDTIQNVASGNFCSIDLNGFSLNSGDTIGFYVHMANSGNSLNYQSGSQPKVVSTSEIDFLSGSGISYNFGNIYHPRYITAKFH
ncbi:MAG: SGNH/GDSL hydrolase family protein, partial [Schleiferiaceae bacterium]|nr:SGNH/GDSL hydrolase family protein [Schleiferiaceae bacterium]